MKCVCQRCLEVIDLKAPRYCSMTDAFWGGECPNCKYYGPMWELNEFIQMRDKFNSVKID